MHTQPIASEPQSFGPTDPIKSDLHSFNAGISGHLGISYKLSTGSLFLEGGGNYGLVDLQKDAADGNNKTGAVVISLG